MNVYNLYKQVCKTAPELGICHFDQRCSREAARRASLKDLETIFIFSRVEETTETLKLLENVNYLLCCTELLYLCRLASELALSEKEVSNFLLPWQHAALVAGFQVRNEKLPKLAMHQQSQTSCL